MKKKWAISLLVLVLVLSLASLLAACGEEETTTTTAAPATETTATTAPPATETTATTAAPTTETTAAGVEDTGQTWELKFSYGVPTQASLYSAYLVPWAEAISKATDGRVTIKHYADGTLAKDDQQYDALVSGTSDIALIEPEYTTGVFPVFEVGSLARLFPNPAVASGVMWDVAQEYSQDELKDVQMLMVATISGAQYVGNVEVKLPADLEGVKMRSGGKVENWTLTELGAEPIDIMLGDLPTSMERGLADGALLSWSLIMSSGAKDYTKYRTHLDLIYRPWIIAMNKDVWESMPVNIQEAIMGVSGKDASVIYSITNEEVTQGARKGLEGSDKGAGNPPIYEPTAEELGQWTTAVQPTYQNWVDELAASKSPEAANGQKILDFIGSKTTAYADLYEQFKEDAAAILATLPPAEH
jgi:TRAP-type C4-dicarboxylate transport system substrate-binding protein